MGWMVSKLVERTSAWYRRDKNVIQRCYNTFGKVRHKSRIEPWLGCMYYVPKSSFLLAGTGVWKISSVACAIKIDYSDYPKSLISRINEAFAFLIKYRYSDLFCCNQTFYCVKMVSVKSASRYHLRYQSRS